MTTTFRLAVLLPALLTAAVTCAHADVQARHRRGFDTEKAQGQRSGSFTRKSDGTASAQRSATATNKETGVTYSGSTTWEKGSGVTREASCKDASGNTVACGEAR